MSTGRDDRRKRRKKEEGKVVQGKFGDQNGAKKVVHVATDSDYLSWMRLGATDKHLLEFRNELRMHRMNAEVNEQNIQAHDMLKEEMLLVMRMLTYFMVKYRKAEEVSWYESTGEEFENNEGDEIVAQYQLTQADLNTIGGLILGFEVTPDDKAWIVTVKEEEAPPGWHIGMPEVQE